MANLATVMPMTPTIHPTTAQLANYPVLEACRRLAQEHQEAFGPTSMDYLQLCPQTPSVMTETLLEELQAEFPHTRFQLHANVRVQPGLLIFDASSYSASTHWYFERLAELSKFLNAPAYSLHSGRRKNCSMNQLFRNVEAIQTLFEMPVVLEGMYPTQNDHQVWLVSSWKEYQMVMSSGLFYAIDLSHLNIVASTEGERPEQVYELIRHPNCLEVHLSHNNGKHDRHRPINDTIWNNLWWKDPWLEGLKARQKQPLHFTEGLYQTRSHRHNLSTTSQRKHHVQRSRTTQL